MEALSLMATLGLDSSDFEKGLSDSSSEANSFASTIGDVMRSAINAVGEVISTIGDLGKKFVNAASEVAQYGDSIDKTSQKFGLSAQSYQEWDFILQHSGSSISAMRTGMRQLSSAVASGSDAFQKLGISQADVASMSQEELFSATISALQNIEDETQRTAIATELFGRSAQELGPLLNTSAEDTEAMRQRVHDLGGVMSDEAVKASARYQDSLQDLQYSLKGIKNNMMANFLPGMATVMDGLADLFSGNDSGIAKITEGIYSVVDNMRDLAPKLAKRIKNTVKQILPAVKVAFKAVVDIIGDLLPVIIDTFTEMIPVIADALPGIIETLLPALMTAASQLIGALIKNLPSILSALWTGIVSAFNTLWDSIKNIDWVALGQSILDMISSAFGSLWDIIKGLFTGGSEGAENDPDIQGVGTRIWTAIKTGLGTAADWLGDIFNDITDELSKVSWSKIGTQIWNGLKTGLAFIGEALLGLLFAPFTDAETSGEWQKLGSSIGNLIQAGINAVSMSISGFITSLAQDILGHDWESDGRTVGGDVVNGVNSVDDFGTGFFDRINKWLHNTFRWDQLGQSVGLLIGSGITALSEFIGGLIFGAVDEGVKSQGPNWGNIGQWIMKNLLGINFDPSQFHDSVNGIFGLSLEENADNLFGMSDLLQQFSMNRMLGPVIGPAVTEFLDNFKVGIEEGLGPIFDEFTEYITPLWEPIKAKLVEFGESVSDPFIKAYDLIKATWERIVDWFEDIWNSITGSDTFKAVSTTLSGAFDTVKSTVEDVISSIQTAIDKIKEFFGLTEQKSGNDKVLGSLKGIIKNATAAGLGEGVGSVDLSQYIAAVEEAAASGALAGYNDASGNYHPIIDVTARVHYEMPIQGPPAPEVNIWGGKKWASAMDSGEILHGLTPFGIGPNGVVHFGGEAGPEAVVGVSSLNDMIQKSVNNAVANIQPMRQPISVQLVLDSGELLGAVDVGLNDRANWRGGGRA